MRQMKRKMLAALMVAVMAGSSMATDVLCGGQIPLINNVIGVGTMTLDFGSAGTAVECAQLFINNNSRVWDLTISTINGGQFENYDGSSIITPTAAGLEVSAGTLVGTLGTGALATFPVAVTLAGAASVTWSATQTTATVMHNLVIKATWLKPTNLAGLYTETIVAAIVATL